MKNLKFILLVFVAVLLSNVVIAQETATATKAEVVKKTKKKSAKKVAKETAAAVAQMDEKQQQMILNYTRNLSKPDTKKEMMKAMKKMSAEDQQKVLDYLSKVTKTAEVKPDMPAVANVKPEVPAYVVKEKEKPQVVPQADPKEESVPVDPATLTKIEILEPTIDFGTIPQGESAKATYHVKNIGDKPLVISKAKGSCGCTVPEWPKEAVAPGEIAEIKVVFNSKGKKGKQNKRITITANTDPTDSFMTITGTVEEPAGTPQTPTGTEEQKGN